MARWEQAYYYDKDGNKREEVYDHSECSECGRFAIFEEDTNKSYLTPYCPYCGEKMENPNIE